MAGNHRYADGPEKGQPIERAVGKAARTSERQIGLPPISTSSWKKFPSLGPFVTGIRGVRLRSQFIKRCAQPAQFGTAAIEMGQSHSKGHPGASMASRTIRRVGELSCPHFEP